MSPVETLNLIFILYKPKNTPPNDSKLFSLNTLIRPCHSLHEVRCS